MKPIRRFDESDCPNCHVPVGVGEVPDGTLMLVEDHERQLAAMTEALNDRDTVPRTRYNACNQDWLDVDAKLKTVQTNARQEIERLRVDVKQEGYLMGLERAAEIANRLGAYEARNAILFQKEPSHEKTD